MKKQKNFSFKQKKILSITLALFFVFVCASGILFTYYFSVNYNDIYGYPYAQDGVYDLTGMGEKEHTDMLMEGEWEFFYNEWIISDATDDVTPDAVVKVPHRWVGSEIDGEKLSTDGYASYRLTLTNISGAERICVYMFNFIGAYRCYINGVLNTSYGNMSKNPNECSSNGMYELEEWFEITDKEPIEVVIELSASQEGGLHACPWLQYDGNDEYMYWRIRYVGMFMGGIILSLCIMVVIVNISIFKRSRNLSFSLLMIFLFLLYFFSADFYWLICNYWKFLNFNIAQEMSYIFGLLLFLCLVVHLIENRMVVFSKKVTIVLLALNLVFIISYYLLIGTDYRIIPIFCQLISASILFYPLSREILEGDRTTIVYTVIFMLCIVFCGILAMDYLDFIVYGMEAAFGYTLILISLAVTTLYFLKYKKTSEHILSTIKLERENKEIKTQALKAQIKPHFIFNSLSCIQSLYAEDPALGNKALTAFSRHLRTNIDAEVNELISFEKELSNILNFCTLENYRNNIEYNVLFDCEVYDFDVPVLSLQPFVENAIKYSKIEKKDDGYIFITSSENVENYLVEIKDNGIGFDPGNVREKALGLKNAIERLHLMIGATVSIESIIGEGTVISISIPKSIKIKES